MSDLRSHPWYLQLSFPTDPSLWTKAHQMTLENDVINPDTIKEMVVMGFDSKQVSENIIRKKHDALYATYYLLEARHEKEKEQNEAPNNVKKSPDASLSSLIAGTTTRNTYIPPAPTRPTPPVQIAKPSAVEVKKNVFPLPLNSVINNQRPTSIGSARAVPSAKNSLIPTTSRNIQSTASSNPVGVPSLALTNISLVEDTIPLAPRLVQLHAPRPPSGNSSEDPRSRKAKTKPVLQLNNPEKLTDSMDAMSLDNRVPHPPNGTRMPLSARPSTSAGKEVPKLDIKKFSSPSGSITSRRPESARSVRPESARSVETPSDLSKKAPIPVSSRLYPGPSSNSNVTPRVSSSIPSKYSNAKSSEKSEINRRSSLNSSVSIDLNESLDSTLRSTASSRSEKEDAEVNEINKPSSANIKSIISPIRTNTQISRLNTKMPLSARTVTMPSNDSSSDVALKSARASPSGSSSVVAKTVYSVSHPTSKSIADIVSEMQRVTTMNRIAVKFNNESESSTPILYCEKGPIRFEMEITSVTNNLHQRVVRMKRILGDQYAYKNLCNRILPQLKL